MAKCSLKTALPFLKCPPKESAEEKERIERISDRLRGKVLGTVLINFKESWAYCQFKLA